MCLCRSERTSFTNGNLKGSINAGRYTADYLQCGNLPYLAWKNAHNCADLSYRRIRRYLVWRLKRLEARDFSRVRIKFLIHSRSNAQGKNHHSRYSAGHPVFKVTEMHHMLGFVHIRKFPGNTCIEAKSQISQSQKCPYQLQNCFSWKFSFLHLRRFPIKSLLYPFSGIRVDKISSGIVKTEFQIRTYRHIIYSQNCRLNVCKGIKVYNYGIFRVI